MMRTQAHVTERRTAPVDDQRLRRRIKGEFAEMPGLRLTLAQAARFFDLSPADCERVLADLVRRGEIWNDGHAFVAAGAGRRWA
jgi:hypothetical protein